MDSEAQKPLENIRVKFHGFGCSGNPSELLVVDTELNHWYVRYRWGCLWVCKNTYNPEEAIWSRQIGGKYDGYMSSPDMCQHTGLDLTVACDDCNGTGEYTGIFQISNIDGCSGCKGQGRIDSPELPDWFSFEVLSNGIKSALGRLQSDRPDAFTNPSY